jgi:hypothetical protein
VGDSVGFLVGDIVGFLVGAFGLRKQLICVQLKYCYEIIFLPLLDSRWAILLVP